MDYRTRQYIVVDYLRHHCRNRIKLVLHLADAGGDPIIAIVLELSALQFFQIGFVTVKRRT